MAGKKTPSIVKSIQKYKLPEINYAFQKSISYSQLSTFTNCPKQWELKYKEGNYLFDASINSIFGTSMHNTIQKYITIMYTQSTVVADQLDLEEDFAENFRTEYKTTYEKNNNTHFSNPEEMREYFDDGIEILNFLKRKKGSYFSKRGWHLVGVEIPILTTPNKQYNNVIFKGFIDLVMYHEPTETFKIYDFKTSKGSWGDYQKKDENKINQLLLYKHFFSTQFNVDINKIEVEFMILKRKMPEQSEFPQKRIQEFIPASGKGKITKAVSTLESFINGCFDNSGYKSREFTPTPSEWGCRFCSFLNTNFCNSGVS